MTDYNWAKKTDYELTEIMNSTDYNKFPNETRIAARSEFNRRQIKNDKYMLRMTAAILVLTIILVYAEFFHKAPSAPMPVTTQQVQTEKLNPKINSQTPQNKNDNKKIISHTSTSTKQK